MGLGGEVHHMGDAMLLDDTEDFGLVAQVDFLEGVFGIVCDAVEVGDVAGVGQAVEVDELRDRRLVDDAVDQV